MDVFRIEDKNSTVTPRHQEHLAVFLNIMVIIWCQIVTMWHLVLKIIASHLSNYRHIPLKFLEFSVEPQTLLHAS